VTVSPPPFAREGEGRRFEFEIRANGVELSEISLRGIAVFRFDIGDDFCERTVSLSHNGRGSR